MAQKLYEESNIQAIADAIRAKGGTSATMKTSEMASAISGISGGGSSGGMVKKTGVIIVSEDCASYTVDTGLSTVHTVIVKAGSQGSVSNTFFWTYDDAVNMGFTGYRSQYVPNVAYSTKVSVNGGSFTLNQYSNDYPIVAKNFNWVAYGE